MVAWLHSKAHATILWCAPLVEKAQISGTNVEGQLEKKRDKCPALPKLGGNGQHEREIHISQLLRLCLGMWLGVEGRCLHPDCLHSTYSTGDSPVQLRDSTESAGDGP